MLAKYLDTINMISMMVYSCNSLIFKYYNYPYKSHKTVSLYNYYKCTNILLILHYSLIMLYRHYFVLICYDKQHII